MILFRIVLCYLIYSKNEAIQLSHNVCLLQSKFRSPNANAKKYFQTFGKSNYKPNCQRLWNVSNTNLDLLIFLITQMPRDYCRKWKGMEFINLNLCHFGNLLKSWCFFVEMAINIKDYSVWMNYWAEFFFVYEV